MSALTVDDTTTLGSFLSEQMLMKPSLDSTPPRSVGTSNRSNSEDDQFDTWLESARQVVETAQGRAAAVPSPTNLIRLAQAQYAVGEDAEAGESALSAMTDAAALIETGRSQSSTVSLVFGSGAILLARLNRHAEAVQLLERIGPPPVLELTYSSLLIDDDRLPEALDALKSSEDPKANALRGYILAGQGEVQRAVHFLRVALRDDPSDADTVMNLAAAYWKLGSRKKAVAAGLRATRLAPSRQDISVGYMDLLLDNNQPDDAMKEVKRLRKAGVIETARLLTIECQVALAKGDPRKSITLMKRARVLAEAEGEEWLAAELFANLRVFEASQEGKNRRELWSIARTCASESPNNVAAIRQLAGYSNRKNEADAVEQAISSATGLPRSARLEVQRRLAFLKCDFGEALRLSQEAVKFDPMDADACAQALLLEGWHLGDWTSAAQRAHQWLTRVPLNDYLINNAAYVMALGGLPHEALKVLEAHSDKNDYVPTATRGLAYLALGDLDTGMRWYRRAGELADSVGESDMRVLMSLHQAAGLRTLGIAESASDIFLAATSLPDAGLPSDWADQPSFVMIQKGCERQGWPWPPTAVTLQSPERSEPSDRSESSRARAQLLAEIEKGQQLAGHQPSGEALDAAGRIIDGNLDAEEAKAALIEKHRRS